ncbi:hypothetical protein GQ53DRAFT_821011 [Thozetella sp. PMI_491]|nr:hypothetical protein GQ53DRAFT_821011 [Thozetella sp. PMI_491]
MHTSMSLLLATWLGAGASTALPGGTPTVASLEPRDNVEVYVCDTENWKGRCATSYDPVGTCYNLDNGQGHYKNIASFGSTQNTYCIVY